MCSSDLELLALRDVAGNELASSKGTLNRLFLKHHHVSPLVPLISDDVLIYWLSHIETAEAADRVLQMILAHATLTPSLRHFMLRVAARWKQDTLLCEFLETWTAAECNAGHQNSNGETIAMQIAKSGNGEAFRKLLQRWTARD